MTELMMTALKLALALGAGTGLLLAAGWLWASVSEGRQARLHPPPGRLVDIGGRRLHLLCKGAAPGPTVVIEQGAGAASFFWWGVQDKVAAFARVCTYDRAGYGWSDPAKRPRSIRDRVGDLHEMLQRAGVPGPYILVGHSYGGPMIGLYARDYRREVAGLVFADTPDMQELLGPDYQAVTRKIHAPMARSMGLATRFGILRLIGLMRGGNPLVEGLPAEARRAARETRRASAWDAAHDEIVSMWTVPEGDRRPLEPGALGAMPVAVISHGKSFPGPFAALERGAEAGQARLAALSADSLRVRLPAAGHLVQVDAPDAVTEIIRRVYVAARDGTALTDKAA